MAFRSDTLTSEFKQSIVDHAVASGRDANCFFQSFFHTLTAQDSNVLNAIKREYKESINAFVDAFNKTLSLEPPVDFDKIMQISKELHPLERECVFGPILRQTYNNTLKNGLISGARELPLSPDAIVFQPETVAFSKAFGAEIFSYMDQEEFKRSSQGGMPSDVAKRISQTEFKIGDKSFYCDYSPQKLTGEKTFNVNIVYAGMHLNYTLGDSKRNNEHRSLIVTRISEFGGIFADRATNEANAPLAKVGLPFSDIAHGLCARFRLTQSEKNIVKEEKQSTAHTANLLGILPSKLPVIEEKSATISDRTQPKETTSPSKTSDLDSTADEVSDEEMAKSAFGQGSNTAKKLRL
jgi:hypothetical protein